MGTVLKSEEVQAERLKQRCPQAWTAFYRASVDGIWRYAHRRLRDADAADEVASRTMLAAVASIDRYDPSAGPVRGWLFGIARNQLAAELRARYRRRRHTVGVDAVETLAGPLDVAKQRETTNERVAAALARLSGQHRDALLSRYRDGLSVADIACRMHRTPKAAENILVRARQRFRQHYRDLLAEEDAPAISQRSDP